MNSKKVIKTNNKRKFYMIKLNDIYYCPKCGHKMFWEKALNTRSRDCIPYSIYVDTYKPELIEHNGQTVKLRFTCRKCKNVELIDYNTCTSDTP